jgi:DNA repair exonuclease SbcCD ATPase subunit
LIDVDVLKNERMRLEGEVEKKSALLKDLLQQLGKLELSLKSLRVERERLARLVEEKGRYLNEFQRNIKRSRDILFEIERLHKEEENLLVRLQKLEADFNEGMLSEARNAVDILRVEEGRILAKLDELRRIKGLKMSDNCPVCGRPLSAEIIRDRMVHIEKETGDLEKQLANVRLQIKNLSDKIAGFEQRRMERQELLSRLEGVRRFLSTSREAEVRAVVERGSDEVERITKEIEDLEGQLSALKKDEEYNEEFWRIKRQVVSLEHEIAELNGELNEINRKIVEQENCRNLIDEYKGRLAVLQRDLQIKMDGLKAFEDSYGYMKWWVDGFKRFQILEIANAIDVLQERLSYYSLMLFEDRMSIKIDVLEQKKTKKDVFDFKNEIHFRINDGVIPFSGFSGGEKQLLALVFLMSVNDLFGFEFVILDEVFGSLDELNRERVLRLLKDISQRKLVLVVTHIDDVKNAADWDGFIKVIRQNGCSSVVLE